MYLSQDIEATIHCAEWLSMIGGSSTGDQRVRYFVYTCNSEFQLGKLIFDAYILDT